VTGRDGRRCAVRTRAVTGATTRGDRRAWPSGSWSSSNLRWAGTVPSRLAHLNLFNYLKFFPITKLIET
jgi:hypothetical protein